MEGLSVSERCVTPIEPREYSKARQTQELNAIPWHDTFVSKIAQQLALLLNKYDGSTKIGAHLAEAHEAQSSPIKTLH